MSIYTALAKAARELTQGRRHLVPSPLLEKARPRQEVVVGGQVTHVLRAKGGAMCWLDDGLGELLVMIAQPVIKHAKLDIDKGSIIIARGRVGILPPEANGSTRFVVVSAATNLTLTP